MLYVGALSLIGSRGNTQRMHVSLQCRIGSRRKKSNDYRVMPSSTHGDDDGHDVV